MADLKCSICGKKGRTKAVIPLVDGHLLHEKCYQDALDDIQELEQRASQTASDISYAERTIKAENGFFKSIFGGRGRDQKIAVLNEQIAEKKQAILIADMDREKSEAKLEEFYDYWPEYPPDWERRRREIVIESDGFCDECGGTGELHVHHMKPISKGGHHKKENLSVLCAKCHEEEHPWMTEKGTKNAKKGPFRQRLETVNKAISLNKKLSFHYINGAGQKTKRTIRPNKLVKAGTRFSGAAAKGFTKNLCVSGYCELRDDVRVFTVAKMNNLKVL
jgi:hypothetical protein